MKKCAHTFPSLCIWSLLKIVVVWCWLFISLIFSFGCIVVQIFVIFIRFYNRTWHLLLCSLLKTIRKNRKNYEENSSPIIMTHKGPKTLFKLIHIIYAYENNFFRLFLAMKYNELIIIMMMMTTIFVVDQKT